MRPQVATVSVLDVRLRTSDKRRLLVSQGDQNVSAGCAQSRATTAQQFSWSSVFSLLGVPHGLHTDARVPMSIGGVHLTWVSWGRTGTRRAPPSSRLSVLQPGCGLVPPGGRQRMRHTGPPAAPSLLRGALPHGARAARVHCSYLKGNDPSHRRGRPWCAGALSCGVSCVLVHCQLQAGRADG